MSLREQTTNKRIAGQLCSILAAGKLVHAFLFIGAQTERLALGRQLAKAILCLEPREGDSCGACVSCRKFDHGNHEDLLFMDLASAPGNAKTQIGVDAVEQLQDQLKLKPFGKRHVVLLDEAHLLNAAAQNKLLKTLEEPAGDSVLILLAERREALLPTVVSRCSTYYLEAQAEDAPAELRALARQFFSLAAQRAPFWQKRDCLKDILEEKSASREKAMGFVSQLEEICRDALISRYRPEISPLRADWPAFEELCAKMDEKALEAAIEAAEDAGRSLKLGYNTGYTLKRMCLLI